MIRPGGYGPNAETFMTRDTTRHGRIVNRPIAEIQKCVSKEAVHSLRYLPVATSGYYHASNDANRAYLEAERTVWIAVLDGPMPESFLEILWRTEVKLQNLLRQTIAAIRSVKPCDPSPPLADGKARAGYRGSAHAGPRRCESGAGLPRPCRTMWAVIVAVIAISISAAQFAPVQDCPVAEARP